MRKSTVTRLVGVLIFALNVGGCARHGAASAPHRSTTQQTQQARNMQPLPEVVLSTAAPEHYQNAAGAVDLTLPAGWAVTPDPDYVLALTPDDANSTGEGKITLDIPKLPPHVPGLIPIGSVRNGYLDDLKTQASGHLTVQDLPAPNIPGPAKVRFERCGWTSSNRNYVELALLVVHNDHVYILRGRSDTEHESTVRQVFDAIVASWQWMTPKSSSSKPAH